MELTTVAGLVDAGLGTALLPLDDPYLQARNLIPLLMLDMWEHAFYLQYKNVKADYVKAVWNVFNCR